MAEKTVLDNNTSSIIKFKDKDGNEFPKWEEKRLGDLFDIFVGGDIDKEHSSIHQTKTYCYPVFANALTDDGLYGYADYYKNIGDTITVTGRGDVGHAVARHCAYVPIVRLLVLVPRYKECVDFFAYQINVTKIFVESTGVPQLTSPQLSKVKMKCPCVDEQEKIASFLMSIDNLISTQESKISILETYNKGLISKIFKQEIRFKDDDGNEFPDWEKVKLSDLVNHYGGTALESLVKENGSCKFISIGNYTPNGKYFDNGQRIDPVGRAKDKLLNKNDLVMVLNDKTKNGTIIGSTILIDDDNYIYNQRSERLICKNNVLANFLWNYINSPVIKNKILQLVQGGTQIYVNFSSVYNLDMYLPCIKEQNRISSFLNQLDDILEQEKVYLNQLKILKRGLLQQMFV